MFRCTKYLRVRFKKYYILNYIDWIVLSLNNLIIEIVNIYYRPKIFWLLFWSAFRIRCMGLLWLKDLWRNMKTFFGGVE